jgi:hypothetical protein
VIGPARFGSRRMPGPMQSMAAGGRAVFRVRMLPISGASRTATLAINAQSASRPRSISWMASLEMDGSTLQFEEQGPLHSLSLVGPTIISK